MSLSAFLSVFYRGLPTRSCFGMLAQVPIVFIFLSSLCCIVPGAAHAQDSFELEVYGSDTLQRGESEVELHSNFNVEAREPTNPRLYNLQHSLNETVEVSHGFTDWLQLSMYALTSINSGYGWQWAGSRIRPQLRLPESWDLPIGLGLSAEVGYQRPRFSEDTWTVELLPIIDKKIGRWYMAFNPSWEKALHGPNANSGFEFSSNERLAFQVSNRVTLNVAYFSSLGPFGNFDPIHQQKHQLVPSVELEFNKWDIEVGYGGGLTEGTNEQIMKFVIGRRFGRVKNDGD